MTETESLRQSGLNRGVPQIFNGLFLQFKPCNDVDINCRQTLLAAGRC